MAHRDNIDVFRASQMTQDKTQPAGNGAALSEGCNAVLGHLACSLRASREAVVRGVASLAKGEPLPAERALRTPASRLAELINIVTVGH